MHKIFYSWQSDTRSAANRTLIERAIEKAIAELKGSGQAAEISPVIDRDTVGVAGSPDISSTILEKIDASSIVVADVTLVDEQKQSRRFPNPNVLIEVGYAIKSLGFSRIILVQNTYFGPVEQLPFDLRGKVVVTYNSDPEAASRVDARNKVTSQITASLEAILPVLEDVDPSDDINSGLDIQELNLKVQEIYQSNPKDAESQLGELTATLSQNSHTPPENHAYVLNRIVDLWRKRTSVSREFLMDLALQSVRLHETSSGYFNIGYVAGQTGRPHESISGYIKAIDLGDPNPSLCYLNAGNRYREMNDSEIALAYFRKAVELNPGQSNAWLALAQINQQLGKTDGAIEAYTGFLKCFNQLPERSKNPSRKHQAEIATEYIDANRGDA